MKDVIAEPYRARLLPGFSQARQAVSEIGALASGISGSGPTLFALCDKPETAQRRGLAEQTLSAKSGRLCSYLPAGYGGRTSSGIINETL